MTVDFAHPFLIAFVTRCLECGDNSEELFSTSKKECRGVEGMEGGFWVTWQLKRGEWGVGVDESDGPREGAGGFEGMEKEVSAEDCVIERMINT